MNFELNTVSAGILLAAGLIILWKCAELLVSGAVGLARFLGISPLVIGLTIVAMGTSAPEVAASIAAALKGAGDVSIGNVYGSNIANLALVGGICAVIRPIRVKLKTLKREIPAMLIVALLLFPILCNLYLSRIEGVILLVLFAAFIIGTAYLARKESRLNKSCEQNEKMPGLTRPGAVKNIILVIAGLAGLGLGADITIRGGIYIGQRIGLSEAVIGLTIIAIGTSLPELVTCLVASLKGQNEIAIGNIVGSNIFNTLLVVGTAGLVRPYSIGARLAGTDYWILIAVNSFFIIAIFLGRKTLTKSAGLILLVLYVSYMVYLFGFTASL